MERNPGDDEYLGAVSGMSETYGIPASHISETAGTKTVYWLDERSGRLKFGPLRGHVGETVLGAYTRFDVKHVRISALIPVPRFFGGTGK